MHPMQILEQLFLFVAELYPFLSISWIVQVLKFIWWIRKFYKPKIKPNKKFKLKKKKKKRKRNS